MTIKILGTGCPKCKELEANAKKAVEISGKDIRVEKVDNIKDIMNYGVMMTPALVINEEVKSAGKVLASDEILSLIS
jgi:small redox-active disulfide protein 2